MSEEKSLQEIYAPNGICFGCGVKNEKGLQIKSFAKGEEVTAEWHGEEHHQAFPGMLNGGIVGALLDCHSNWTAAHFLMKQKRQRHARLHRDGKLHGKIITPHTIRRNHKIGCACS